MIPTSTSRLGLLPPPTTESMPRSGKYTLSIFRLAISIVLRRSRATGSSRGWIRARSSADMAASRRFLNFVGGLFGDKALALCVEARARGVSLSAACAPEGRLQAIGNFTPPSPGQDTEDLARCRFSVYGTVHGLQVFAGFKPLLRGRRVGRGRRGRLLGGLPVTASRARRPPSDPVVPS